MVITLKDKKVCETCLNKTCSFVDAVVKHDFFDIRTETTVCPVGILIDGPDLDADSISGDESCVHCGICVRSCGQKNIKVSISDNERCDYSALTEQQLNAIACTYLNRIIGFAANTNRNRAMMFDGYAVHRMGLKMFVEVDWNDDSLECTRRLLGDFLTNPSSGSIEKGIVVLQNFPKRGTHDVFDMLEKLKTFPTTKGVCIYFSTFDVLRKLYLSLDSCDYSMENLFYEPLKMDSIENYIAHIDRLCKTKSE